MKRLGLFLVVIAGCGGSDATHTGSSACDTYLACVKKTADAAGDSSAYDQAAQLYGSSSACNSSAQAEALCQESCQAAINELGSSCDTKATTSQGPTQDAGTPSPSNSCVTSTFCTSSLTDCSPTERCNTALDPPRCQTLYCGAFGTPCGNDIGSANSLCQSRTCGFDDTCESAVVSTPDMAMPTTKLTCPQFVTCLGSCTDPDFSVCTSECQQKSTPAVSNTSFTGLYDHAIACEQTYCLGTTAAPYKCALSTDGTSFTELGGAALTYDSSGNPTSPCAMCLEDTTSALFGTPCTSPTSPDCSATFGSAARNQCASPVAACTTD